MVMGLAAAKQGDQIIGVDIHLVMVPTPLGDRPTPLPHPFAGLINSNLSENVKIMGLPAATVGSTAINNPPHLPTPPGTSFLKPPTNQATIRLGSLTVKINGKLAARNTDMADTCNDPSDIPAGKVVAVSTVFIG
jgi:uncharacterized Zn-binding protein involved in type VI secretion